MLAGASRICHPADMARQRDPMSHASDVARAAEVWQVARERGEPDPMLRAARWLRELRIEGERDDARARAWAARQPGASMTDTDAAMRRAAAMAAYQSEVITARLGGPDEQPGDAMMLGALARTIAAMGPRGDASDAADALASDPAALAEALRAAAERLG